MQVFHGLQTFSIYSTVKLPDKGKACTGTGMLFTTLLI